MRSHSQTAPTRGARIITVALSALALVLSSATSVRAQDKEKADADAEFLTKVVPSIAASVKIIEYEVKKTSDEKVRDFAERVWKQHEGSVKTASEHAKRLNIAVDTDGEKDSKETIDQMSKLKGSDLDVAFLEWLSHIHHDTTLFENEVKNGADPELKTYAKNSITAGNEHLKEARELLAKLKK
jgi:putative membrane protein